VLSISRRRGKPPLQVSLRDDTDTDVSKYRIKSRISSAPSPPNAIVGHIPIIGAAQISFDPFWAPSWRLERLSLSASIDAVDVAKKLRVEGEGGMPSRWPRGYGHVATTDDGRTTSPSTSPIRLETGELGWCGDVRKSAWNNHLRCCDDGHRCQIMTSRSIRHSSAYCHELIVCAFLRITLDGNPFQS